MNISLLENIPFIPKIFYFQQITSTNEKAKKMLPLEDFTLFIAETQTKGKGRNYRQWYSPAKENLYFSFVLKVENQICRYSAYPLIVAYSLLNLAKKYIDKKIFIKWPNDIYIEDRKIAGTLIEINNHHIITGIGINVNSEDFPVFQNNKPTSFYKETSVKHKREYILKDFLYFFKNSFDLFKKELCIRKEVLDEVNDNLKFRNKVVEIVFNDHSKRGIIKGINEKGFLILDNNTTVYAGDVLKVRSVSDNR